MSCFIVFVHPYICNVLPASFLSSLQNVKGFNNNSFEAIHASGEQVTSIRINPAKWTLDTNRFLNNSVSISPENAVPWCKHGYYLPERPSFTLDPLLHAGAYYVQEASSMFLWQMLEQLIPSTTNKKVLDIAAAPGGKSTLLASYFSDGLVIANEVIKARAAVLVENCTKWGSNHVIVTNNDPAHFQSLKNYFDLIVIDAPCSGSGLFRKDSTAINEWSAENVKLCSLRQQRIVADVLPALKKDGILIYSTCSYSPQENEDILDWMIENYQLSSMACNLLPEWNIVENISTKHGATGYRFYPDKLKGEGFFIAAFKKDFLSENAYLKEQELAYPSKKELQVLQSFYPYAEHGAIFKQNNLYRLINKEWMHDLKLIAKHLYIKKAGTEIGAIKNTDVIPSHELAVSTLPLENFTAIETDKETALRYLRKKEITLSSNTGWQLIQFCELPLGWVKVLPNRINNYYPSEWRILKD